MAEHLICKDEDGNLFLSFENIPEKTLSEMPELTHCLAVVRLGGLYGVTLDVSLEVLQKATKDEDEIGMLSLYSQIKGKAPIALIDEKLIGYYA